jgi:hypothetical protein
VVCAWGCLAAVVGTLWLPPDELSWSQALAKLLGRGRGGYGRVSAEEEGGAAAGGPPERTETEFQSYARILHDKEVAHRLLPLVRPCRLQGCIKGALALDAAGRGDARAPAGVLGHLQRAAPALVQV